MTTSITFSLDGGTPVPNVDAVPVVSGDSIKLSGGNVKVYFSPALAAILSPAPSAFVLLEGATTPEFTFTSSAEGAYSLLAAGESHPPPTHFSTAPTAHLLIAPVLQAAPEVTMSFPITGGTTSTNN